MTTDKTVEERAAALVALHRREAFRRSDALFARLMVVQGLGAIVLAVTAALRTPIGASGGNRALITAVFLAGLVVAVAVLVARRQPGTARSRHVVAVGQSLLSGLLIHATGGGFASHVHVFASLALLACYRDWKVLVSASLVVALVGSLDGLLSPGSPLGAGATRSPIESLLWIAFADIVLIGFCRHELRVVHESAARQAHLESVQREHDLMQVRAAQSRKLESIGQLSAGIAHEINTPVQFVSDNLRFVADGLGDLAAMVACYRGLVAPRSRDLSWDERCAAAAEIEERLDLDFFVDEAPAAVEEALVGVDQVARIVRSMREFSHPGTNAKSSEDLNHAISNTVAVARNEWKYTAEVELDLAPDLPLAPCYLGELNQVVLNMIVNASQSIREKLGSDGRERGRIRITTSQVDDQLEVRIADTGGGIPEDARQRIFDPFFTTKEVGQGTGQGLAIAHDVIVGRHGGSIEVETELGVGTTFVVRIPVVPDQVPELVPSGASGAGGP